MDNIRTKIESLIKGSRDERPRYITLLAEEIAKKRLVVFVGAGCSMSLGLPSWSELIDELLRKYNIKSKESDVFRLASRLERDLGPLKFREEVVANLRINEIGKSDLHDALINLDTNLFITTNYDTLLEDYFKFKGFSPFVITNSKDIPSIDSTKKTIVKLHGDLNSPTSLVITASDYTKYKSKNDAFIALLNSVAARMSFLFVGASFDDPRLKDVDDYVLNIFGSDRRQPFIFFKIPGRIKGKSGDDFAVEVDDFEALCDELRDRGYYLILVENYEDIAEFLKEVNEKALEENVKEDPGNLGAQLKLQNDYSGKLERSLNILIDDKIKELVKKVLGEGRPPGISKIRKGLKELIEFLNNPPHRLGPESRLQGLLCVTDAFLIISKTKSEIIKARQYYEQANEVFRELKDKSKFQERLIRLRAKLLFEEGKTDKAINSLAKSKDPKTISFRLLYLTESKRIDEAYDFIEKNDIKVQWVSEALRIYILKGKLPEAEKLFWEKLEEFEFEKEKGNIEDTDYKGDFFFDSMCFAIIHSIYYKALPRNEKKYPTGINPFDLSDDARRLLRKSLEFVDLFFKKRPASNPGDDYRVIHILLIEMGIYYFLRKFDRADETAKKLLIVKPIERQVVSYILERGKTFPERSSVLKDILKKLEEDHNDQSWAWLTIANIEILLENKENSWNALKRTITLIDKNDKEKNETLLGSFLLAGKGLDKLDELVILFKSTFQFNDEEIFFWYSLIDFLSGNPREAFEKIKNINESNFSLELRAWILKIKGQWEIENQNWGEAKILFSNSFDIYPEPLVLISLLFVLTKLQDNVEILQVAEKIESFGIEDDQVTLVKAQASRNLRQFEKSEKAWKRLREKHIEKPEYALEHARVLSLLDKEKEAIKILVPFIQPGDKFDLNCLRVALELYSILEENEEAFSILEKCWLEIQEQPDLIWKHVELAFKTDNEQKTQKSLKRMEELKEEGKITDMVFFKSDNLEELINIEKKRRGSVEKVFGHYRLGDIPRIKVCEIISDSLYLDWARRTQPLKNDSLTAKGEEDFTIYSTNGFKLDRVDKNIRFVPIDAPKEAEEIVIDYHALITIHRLGFMGKLCKRYKKIYYPNVFKLLWKMEQTRYTPFQLSKEKAYGELAKRLNKNEIKKAAAPIKETRVDRNLSLAQIEKVPLIDNYIKKEETAKYAGVPIIRLPQVVDWIYEKGRLSENKWEEIKKYTGGEPWLEKENWKKTLDNMRFVVDSITLGVMEEFEIIQKLIDMGAVLFVEEHTADEIHFNIRNFKFFKDVAIWHKQLIQEISGNSKFVEVKPDDSNDERELIINESLYVTAAYEPMKYCNEKNLFLLTDDRWTQKLSSMHFGTDALLRDLFEKGEIDIEEYTKSFLQLCEWRYRFLLPDVRTLVFLAEQYRKSLPGKTLEFIASYLRKSMEDPGLSLAIGPTIPNTPIAWIYFLSIIDVWFKFLVEIWQNEDVFEEAKLNDITDWFYRYAMPDFPQVIKEGMRDDLYKKFDSTLSLKIFSIIMRNKNPIRLHKFLSKSFENLFENSDRKEVALIDFIKNLKNFNFSHLNLQIDLKNPQEAIKNFFLIKVLETFFGKEWPKPMEEVEKRPRLAAEVSKIIPLEYNINQEEIEYLSKTLAKYLQNREEISEYTGITPFIVVKRTSVKEEGVFLHELLKFPSSEIKVNALKLIEDAEYITDYTKKKIEKLKERMISSTVVYRQAASEEAVKLLLKDFQYLKSIIDELKEMRFRERPMGPLKAILTPDLSTVIWNPPLLIKENLKIKDITLQIKEQVNKAHSLKDFLDWFLEECFFVPLGHPLNPWTFVNEFIEKSGISCKEVLYFLKDWIKGNRDPLAYLIAIEIVLNLRSKVASEKEKVDFIGKDFFAFLDRLLETLLMEVSEEVSMDKHLFENIKERWLFRTELSRYYLKYIDLNFNEPADDEYKVLLAWWMARDIEKTLIENFSVLYLEEQTLLLKENLDFIKMERPVNLEHNIRYREKTLSIARYYTMVKSPPLTTSVLTLAIINPQNTHTYAFNGLKKPTLAFNPKFTDAIIHSLPMETLGGEEQIITAQKGKLPFLWELPFCISAPAFLRDYYADAFDFLGKDKVNLIKFTEDISEPGYLKNNLINLIGMKKAEKITNAPLLLRSLNSYVQLHGEMPPGAVIFKKQKGLLKEFMLISPPHYKILCFYSMISIFRKMISVGDSEWVEVLRQQLEVIDYDNIAKHLAEMKFNLIEDHIIIVVILGFDVSILDPILKEKTTSKTIREILGRVKSILESNFTHVPIENRENLRKFLNQIADVPAISEENKNGG